MSTQQEKRMADVSLAVTDQTELEDEVERLTAKLKIANAKLHIANTEETPLAMTLAGIAEYKTAAGLSVKVKPFVSGTMPKDDPELGYDALRDVGMDSIIKWTVTIPFGMDEEAKALKLVDILKVMDYEPESKISVHAGSLKAAFRQHFLTPGFPFTTIFGGFAGRKATIVRPKS